MRKTVVLGVSGSIAAYRGVEVASALVQRGLVVRVVMTAAAQRFVSPLTFESIVHQPVLTDLWAEQPDMNISHVRLGEIADALAIVPATADIIARLSLGLADDALTSTALATQAPLLIAPAMNSGMWLHPATQAHLSQLRARGAQVVGPVHGRLAEGHSGPGRLAPVTVIVDAICHIAEPKQDFRGKHIVVTAGPTREALDPVRFISNRSSGKMGYALAVGALERGATVTLISGPVALTAPAGASMRQVLSAGELLNAVQDALTPNCILIMAAAVADYMPRHYSDQKIKRRDAEMVVELVPCPDILQSLRRPAGMKVVAFAAETQDTLEHATKKMVRKRADLLVANDVSEEGAGFESDTNHVWLLRPNEAPTEVPLASKQAIANVILDTVSRL